MQRFSEKLEMESLYDPAVPLQSRYPKEMKPTLNFMLLRVDSAVKGDTINCGTDSYSFLIPCDLGLSLSSVLEELSLTRDYSFLDGGLAVLERRELALSAVRGFPGSFQAPLVDWLCKFIGTIVITAHHLSPSIANTKIFV